MKLKRDLNKREVYLKTKKIEQKIERKQNCNNLDGGRKNAHNTEVLGSNKTN